MLIIIYFSFGTARSLKSKVKRLKEERERGLAGEAAPASKKEEEREAANGSTEEAGGENGVSGEPSGRSCKESTSSDLKPPPGHDSGGGPADGGKPEVKEEPADVVIAAAKKESSGESVAGSKEADAEKESSDVQSAASPSRRRRRRRLRKVGGGELASASAPVALPAADAEPLLAFLESVRTSKSGSVFERRLESQVISQFSSRAPFIFGKKSLIFHFPPSHLFLPSVKNRKCYNFPSCSPRFIR
jgi:hypothetical protein